MFEFLRIEYLWALLLAIPMLLFVKNKKSDISKIFKKEILEKVKVNNGSISNKSRSLLLIGAFVFMVIALARPIINNGEIEIKSNFINMVVGIDISKSMFADDVYPSRFEFAKKKFIDMLPLLKNTKVALMGFSSQTFLISPLTEDFHSLKFLSSNLRMGSVTLKGTDVLTALQSANDLLKEQKNKILLLFTDGGDKKDFSQEIAYAKAHNITVYIYAVGTHKGGVIKDSNGVMKDRNGNIVVVKLNPNIKELALKTGGAYMEQSLKKDDIKAVVDAIHSHFKAENESVEKIRDKRELFVIPLAIALGLLFFSLFSLPNFRRAK
jgi:Ca-activated chloride channel family protein